ncbi:hypothetical protein [Streptomyces sp. NBC_00102]|uniref:hypothetical protein n=1 Tax=Streptomyces sp. NBC_00102 TaxID=2975652 RepID=UPI00224FC3D1|nr:hypothetical protein [Streptomyces sp. NBC_00102]MCX5400454.1 hypothetical protein [Streptomyces sp. NBC_00102]
MRQSEESATRNGIQALEMAYSGIVRSCQDVENTRLALGPNYGGKDGGRYQELIKAWEDQGQVIITNVQGMIDALNETLQQQGLTQGANDESVQQSFHQSQAVFDTMVG